MALTKITGEGVGAVDNLTVDTNTLVVDAANNRVGVGTASPAATQHTLSGDALVSVQATTNSTTGYHEYRYNTSTAVGYIGNGSSLLSGANNSDFIVRSQADLVFNSNGNNERLRVLSGGGLTFNGDTAAANALSDYEEGVAGVSFSALGGGSVSVDTTSNGVGYTKIGRKVHIQGEIRVNSVSSPSGFMALNNLPFVSSTGGAELSDRVYGSLLWYDASAATYNNIGGTLVANSQQMTLTGESGGSFQFGAGDTITLGFSYNTQ